MGEFAIEFKSDHFELQSDGEKSIEFAYKMWRAVLDACEEHSCYHVLGIANTTRPLTPVEGFEHAEMFWELDYPPLLRVAWVEQNKAFAEAPKFVETVLFNRGIGEFRVFDDVDEAKNWLFSDEGV